jgi:hypothetical protein
MSTLLCLNSNMNVDIEARVTSSNYAILENHIVENHYGIMTHNGTMTSPKRCIRKQGRLSYNPVHEFYQRVHEKSKCKECLFMLMGHNPNTNRCFSRLGNKRGNK